MGTSQEQLLLFDSLDAFLICCSKVFVSFFLNQNKENSELTLRAIDMRINAADTGRRCEFE